VSSDRDLDVVVLGATGYAGRLVAGYLAGHAPGGVRIGLAGRSRERLAGIRARLGAASSSWPLLTADVTDPPSLAVLARATRVVVTTAGPYRRHGLALVEACATAGTDYADLAGEVLFMRESIDRYHQVAAAAGTRVVHCCGVDSIPSDLGVLLLHEAARADGAGDLEDTTLVVTAFKGGMSGGTLASGQGQIEEMRASAAARAVVADPYALSPDRAAEPHLGAERDLEWITRDDDLGGWVGPFLMAGINTRVVRRSNALQGWAYGRRFRYREVTGFGAGPAGAVKGTAVTAAITALTAGIGFGPSRALLGPRTAATRPGPQRKDSPHGPVPDEDPHAHLGRRGLCRHRSGPRRPGLPGHLGDARRNRAVPGAGSRPLARPRRRPHPRDRDGHHTGRQAEGGRAYPHRAADQPITVHAPGRRHPSNSAEVPVAYEDHLVYLTD
jgi:short subunit dehydrogenase-like uncharacterized protein